MMDNEQIYKICEKRLGIPQPNFRDVNAVISDHLSSITASMRFGGTINKTFDDMVANLVPFFSRMHFLTPSKALHVPVDD